jgi:hypothetical protein
VKARIIARILACLRHAEANTPEVRVAAETARRLQARHGITDLEIAQARGEQREEERHQVELPGWEEPWRIFLAGAVAELAGVRLLVAPGPKVAMVGPGAGRAARRADFLRLRVEARVLRAGGPQGVAALPLRRVFVSMLDAPWGATSLSSVASSSARVVTLGEAFGPYAPDVFRVTVVSRLLAPEVDAARARAEEEARRRVQEGASAPPPSRPEPAAAAPEQAEAGPGAPPPPPPPPPIAGPADPEAFLKLQELQRRLRRLVEQAREVGQPEWVAEEEPEAALVPA